MVSALLFTSCTQQAEIQNPKPPLVVTSSLTNNEKVCQLVSDLNTLFGTKNFDEFFDEDLWSLAELTSPTYNQIIEMNGYIEDGIALMYSTDASTLEDDVASVLSMELTTGQLDDYLAECDLPQPRWCLICSTGACIRSTIINTLASNGIGSDNGLISYIGMWLHCDH